MDLRGRDIGPVLGLASRVPLTEQAGPQETGNGQPEDQRYRCYAPRRDTPTPRGHQLSLLRRNRQGKGGLKRRGAVG
jgi:hypothetical protein